MDCQNCEFAQKVVGSSHHQSCKSPLTNKVWDTSLLAIIGVFSPNAGLIVIPEVRIGINTIPAVICNEHGVKKGWCCFPFNFDPVWIDFCLINFLRDQHLDHVIDMFKQIVATVTVKTDQIEDEDEE